MGFPGSTNGKELPADAGDTGAVSLIPGWGRSPGGGNDNLLSILAWRIPRTEEPGRLQSTGLETIRYD